MFNRKYKKGMADAAKAYQAFGQKQEEALEHILAEVRQGNKTMEEAIQALDGHLDGLYDHLKSQEKAKLYTVYTPFDIKELGEKERLFLLGALLRLTVDKAPNEGQQNYIRAIQRYLDVKEPPFGVDLTAIENIEDLPSQKAILQTVLEYLRIQDGDSYDETELQQEFLDSFSVSGKARSEIVNHVELLYSATGAQGLAEKYGFVSEEDLDDENEDDQDDSGANVIGVTPEQEQRIDDFVSVFGPSELIETANYVLYVSGSLFRAFSSSGPVRMDKNTGEKVCFPDVNVPIGVFERDNYTILGDTIYTSWDGGLTAFDVSTMSGGLVAKLGTTIRLFSAAGDKVAFMDNDRIPYVFDPNTKKCTAVRKDGGENTGIASVLAVPTGFYFTVVRPYAEGTRVLYYDYKTKKISVTIDKRKSLSHLYHVTQSGIFYAGHREYCDKNIYRIDLGSKEERAYEYMDEHSSMVIRAYPDMLIYVAPGGIIRMLDYETGETTDLAKDAAEEHYVKGGIFSSSSSWDTPVRFYRIGDAIYYHSRGESDDISKISLSRPGEKEILIRMDLDEDDVKVVQPES